MSGLIHQLYHNNLSIRTNQTGQKSTTKTTLNSENITQAIYFISGLEKLQKMQNL